MNPPLISIVIPTINRYSDLQNTLNDLQQQSVREYEVLIIDQTDVNDFCSIHFPQTKHLHKAFKSASKARNVGLLEAKAPIVLFLDDDVMIENPDF